MNLTRYQQVIFNDVRSANYPRDRRWLRVVFSLVGAALVALFFHAFYGAFLDHFEALLDFYRLSTGPSATGLVRAAVYVHLRFILFTAFAGVCAVVLVFFAWACDMQARNEIIRLLLAEGASPPSDPPSQT